ncbi:MAG: hypothetical protein ACK559_08530, partial [bacterium]
MRAAAGRDRHDESHRAGRERSAGGRREDRQGRGAGRDRQAGCRQRRVHGCTPVPGRSMGAGDCAALRRRVVRHVVDSRVEGARSVIELPPALRARGGVRTAPELQGYAQRGARAVTVNAPTGDTGLRTLQD